MKALHSNTASSFFGENVAREYAALWTTEDEAESKLSSAIKKQLVERLHEVKRTIDDWATPRWNAHDRLVGAPRSGAVTPSAMVYSCLGREDLLYFCVVAGWGFENEMQAKLAEAAAPDGQLKMWKDVPALLEVDTEDARPVWLKRLGLD